MSQQSDDDVIRRHDKYLYNDRFVFEINSTDRTTMSKTETKKKQQQQNDEERRKLKSPERGKALPYLYISSSLGEYLLIGIGQQ